MSGIRYTPEEYARLKTRDVSPRKCNCPSSDAWVCNAKQGLIGPCACSCHGEPKKRNPRGHHEAGKMNKSEQFYANTLELRKKAGEIKDWKFESVKLKLADRCTYTPDFNIEMANEDLVMVEVKRLWKGKKAPHWEDDARCKVKVAAKDFRGWFQFYGVHWDGEKWVYELF